MACFVKPAKLHSPGQVQGLVLFCSEMWPQPISTTELSCHKSKIRERSPNLYLPSEIPLGTRVLVLPQLLGDFPHKHINFVLPTRSCTVTWESTAKPRFRIRSKLMSPARKARHLWHFFFSSLTYVTTPRNTESLGVPRQLPARYKDFLSFWLKHGPSPKSPAMADIPFLTSRKLSGIIFLLLFSR